MDWQIDELERRLRTTNPLTPGIRDVFAQLRSLDFSLVNALPSAITGAVLIFVILFLSLLWPYGLCAIIENMFRGLVFDTRRRMASRNFLEQTPDAVAIGFYSILWIPALVALLPLIVIGDYIRFLISIVERSGPYWAWLAINMIICAHLTVMFLLLVLLSPSFAGMFAGDLRENSDPSIITFPPGPTPEHPATLPPETTLIPTPTPTSTFIPTPTLGAPATSPLPTTFVLPRHFTPHIFVGTATIDGNPAPDGTIVTALIDGEVAGSATVHDGDGTYSPLSVRPVKLPFGREIVFKIDSLIANQTATWERGGADVLNLTTAN